MGRFEGWGGELLHGGVGLISASLTARANGHFSPLPTSNLKLQYKGEKPFQPVAQ